MNPSLPGPSAAGGDQYPVSDASCPLGGVMG